MGRSNTPNDVFRFIDTKGNDPDVCWPWTGTTGGRDGRGYMSLEGKKRTAYLIVFEIFNGHIPTGMVVRHTCDNPLCCNPKHLILGTRSQNEQDKYDRDRVGYSHDMIREMRRMNKLGMTYQTIADQINRKFKTDISASGVGKVIRGDRRKKS